MTQLQQALTYQTAVSLWRRLKGSAAHCMGVLYWQLNDVWLVGTASLTVSSVLLVLFWQLNDGW